MKAKFDITVWFESDLARDETTRKIFEWAECEEIEFEDVEIEVDQKFPMMAVAEDGGFDERDEYMQGLLAELIRITWNEHTQEGEDAIIEDLDVWFEQDAYKVSPVATVEKVTVHNHYSNSDEDLDHEALWDTLFEDVRTYWRCKTSWSLVEIDG